MNLSNEPHSGRAWLDVSLANLLANARAVLDQAQGARLLPMVKANAYGLGAVPCARALDTLDPWGYGVATLGEAAELRAAGLSRPILVFTPATPADLAQYQRMDLRAVLDRRETLATWSLPFHVEIDTGMSRCGVRWDDVETLRGAASPHLEGVFTHFACADTDPDSVAAQWRRFAEARKALGTVPKLVHAANSAGAWRLRERLDLVRPGIFLYGGEHAPDLPPPRTVATLRAPVVSLRRVRKGDGVSYGADWRAPADTVIATLGVGFADGVPRAVRGKAHVVLAGARRPVVGRVTMDFVMVDVGPDGAGVEVGDVGVFFGAAPLAPTVEEFSGWAESNAYEVLARLGARLERRYDARTAERQDGNAAGGKTAQPPNRPTAP